MNQVLEQAPDAQLGLPQLILLDFQHGQKKPNILRLQNSMHLQGSSTKADSSDTYCGAQAAANGASRNNVKGKNTVHQPGPTPGPKGQARVSSSKWALEALL